MVMDRKWTIGHTEYMEPVTAAMIGGLLVGLVCGVPAGMLVANVRRGWVDVGAAKKAVPVARKGAWGRTREAFLLGFLLVIAVALAIGARTHGG